MRVPVARRARGGAHRVIEEAARRGLEGWPGVRDTQARADAAEGASLGASFPLLAQEVLEIVHQLLRVEGVVTLWARCRVTRRIIGLL